MARATKTYLLTQVPGVKIRLAPAKDLIIWPSGKTTLMHCWPLRDEEDYKNYMKQPIHMNAAQVANNRDSEVGSN